MSEHDGNSSESMAQKVANSSQFNGAKFENYQRAGETNPALWPMLKMYMFEKQQPATPKTSIEVTTITKEQLLALQRNYQQEGMVFFRLGHSTLLILLDGEYWLTDPVFAERAHHRF